MMKGFLESDTSTSWYVPKSGYPPNTGPERFIDYGIWARAAANLKIPPQNIRYSRIFQKIP